LIFKLLLLIIIITLVYFIFFKKKNSDPKSENSSDKNSNVGEELIPCYKCGILTAESETIIHNGQQFCSKECAGI